MDRDETSNIYRGPSIDASYQVSGVIERTFGIWKMRFRCIYRELNFTPKRSQYIVLATAGLHNKCVRKRLPLPEDYDMHDDDNVDNVGQINTENGRRIRQEVIGTIFGEV
jgi:hypothetical protein